MTRQHTIDSPRRARQHGAGTSKLAAGRSHDRTLELRRRILSHLQSLPPEHPAQTADEIFLALGEALGVDLYEVRRRVSDLHRAGLIVDSNLRGETARGSTATKWGAATLADDVDIEEAVCRTRAR